MTDQNEAGAGPALPDGHVWVQDTTARAGEPKREHTMPQPDGSKKSYLFGYGERVAVPMADAAKFMRYEAFLVSDANGRKVEPPPAQPGEHREGVVRAPTIDDLPTHVTVARYDELTGPALLARAQALPGGEEFKTTTKKADLIEFLIARREISAAQKTRRGQEGGAGGGSVEDMDAAALNKLFGDDEAEAA